MNEVVLGRTQQEEQPWSWQEQGQWEMIVQFDDWPDIGCFQGPISSPPPCWSCCTPGESCCRRHQSSLLLSNVHTKQHFITEDPDAPPGMSAPISSIPLIDEDWLWDDNYSFQCCSSLCSSSWLMFVQTSSQRGFTTSRFLLTKFYFLVDSKTDCLGALMTS